VRTGVPGRITDVCRCTVKAEGVRGTLGRSFARSVAQRGVGAVGGRASSLVERDRGWPRITEVGRAITKSRAPRGGRSRFVKRARSEPPECRSRLVCRQPPPVSRCSFRFLSLVFQALIFSTANPLSHYLPSCISVYTRVYTTIYIAHKNVVLHSSRRAALCSPFSPVSRLPFHRHHPHYSFSFSPFASSGLYTESSHRAVSMSIRGCRPSLPSAPRTVVRRCT